MHLRDHKVAIHEKRSSLFAIRQLIGVIYPRAVGTRNTRDYVRERVTNYRQLPQVQRRTLLSLALSQSTRTIPEAFGEEERTLFS